MLKMPTKTGYMVEWETNKIGIKNKPIKDSYCTTSYEVATRIKAEKEDEGCKNVQIYECIF